MYPQPGDPVLPAVCQDGFPYHRMSNVLVVCLREFFKDPSNIQSEFMRPKYWRKTPTPDSMLIELASSWVPSQATKRYSLVVSQQDFAFQSMSIGGVLHGGTELDGHRTSVKAVVSQNTIAIAGASEPLVLDLAADVVAKLTAFGMDIIQAFGLLSFNTPKLGKPARVKESQELNGVPVVVSWASQISYTVMPQAPILADVATTYDNQPG